jgi:hypothetical protein
VEAWIYPTTVSGNHSIASYRSTSVVGAVTFALNQSNSDITFTISDDSLSCLSQISAPSALVTNTWFHIVGVRNGNTDLQLYVNGVLKDTDTIPSPCSTISANIMSIGAQFSGSSSPASRFAGNIDEVKVFNYARTSGQIFESMNAGHPAPGSPISSAVAHWKFDEGYGTTANDATPNDNDLTLSTATSAWTRSAKFNQGWDGNASRYLSRADDADFDVAASDDYSISLWFKSDNATNPGTRDYILNKGPTSAVGYAVFARSDGTVCFGMDDDTTFTPDDSSCSDADVIDGSWHHFAAVKTGQTSVQVFIDGKPQTADTTINATGTLANSSTLYIGDLDGTDNGDEFNGDLDEIKIYRGALTQSQIEIDMNKSVSQALSGLGTNTNAQPNAAAQQYCIPGDTSTCTAPVGEWLFSERTGSTVNDTSGSGNTGTWQGTLGSQWSVKGRGSSAGNFNGSDNYLTVTDSSGLNSTTLTQEAWVYPRANGTWASIINRRTAGNSQGWTMEQNFTTGSLQCQYGISGTTRTANATTALTLNAWNHVACSYDGSTLRAYVNGIAEGSFGASGSISNPGSPSVYIGRNVVNADHFNGLIDMVRVYGYARTPAQIAWSATDGNPSAHWKMDECQGSAVSNSISNTLHGALTIGGSGTNTAIGTCATSGARFDGATGKRNSALDFDGTDDYVSITTPTSLASQTMSYAAWVKRASTGNNNAIFAYTNNASSGGTVFYFDTSNRLAFAKTGQASCTSTSTITDTSNWNHVAVTYDGANCRFYINGKLDASPAYSQTFSYSGNATIGGTTTTNSLFEGQIDDLRVYIYPITQTQIDLIMNDGAYRVGPVSGAP